MNVTYDDYKNVYGGTIIPSTRFTGYAMRADAYVNYITQGQSDTKTEYADKVKLAICAAADAIFKTEGKEFVTSESASGVSASYDTKAISKLKRESIKPYLASTGMMYSGV